MVSDTRWKMVKLPRHISIRYLCNAKKKWWMWRVVYDEHFSSNVKPSNGKVAGNRPNDQFWNDAYSWMSLFTREKKRWLVFDVMYLFPNRLTQQQDVCVLVWWAVLPLCVPPCSAQRERQFPFWRTSYTPRTSLIHISVSLVWYFTPTVLIFNRNRKIKKNKKRLTCFAAKNPVGSIRK